jgi:leader peptidase (prepilin peptidase) / N-methyltransferase
MASLNEAAYEPGDVHDVAVSALAWVRAHVVAVAASAALGALVLARVGVGAAGILGAALVVTLVVLAAIDVERRVLPNRIVLSATAATLALALALDPSSVPLRLLAAFGAAALFLLPSLLRPGAFGMGDVKLAFLLGAALGHDIVDAVAIGVLAAAGAAAVYVARSGRGALTRTMAFGPFLALGGIATILASGVRI